MLLYPGLPATGTIDLGSQQAFDSSFTVTDGIGGILNIDSNGEYKSENGTVVVTLNKALSSAQRVYWYVDGVEMKPDVSGNTYTFTSLAAGKRCIVGIVVDNETEAAIGALQVKVDVRRTMGIEQDVKEVVVSYFDVVSNYSIPLDSFNIGLTADGVNPVDFPYTVTPVSDDGIEGYTPAELGLEPIDIVFADLGYALNEEGNLGLIAMPENTHAFDSKYMALPESVKSTGSAGFDTTGILIMASYPSPNLENLVFPKSFQNLYPASFYSAKLDMEAMKIDETPLNINFQSNPEIGVSENYDSEVLFGNFSIANIGEIHFPEESPYIREGMLLIKGDTVVAIINSALSKEDILRIPDGIKHIAPGAHDNGTLLSATYIGGPKKFTEIILPDSLETIGSAGLATILTEKIIIPKSVTKIGNMAMSPYVCVVEEGSALTDVYKWGFGSVSSGVLYLPFTEEETTSWNADWFNNGAVYYKGHWSYGETGEPEPII